MTAGRQVRGIVEGDSVPEIFIPHLIELHKQGRFPYDRMLKFYQFDEINQAIADSELGVTIKPIIKMPA
jgi:aryl-alcohol dehydrogenase